MIFLRKEMYIKGFKMFEEHPISGFGWNAFAAKSGIRLHSHNNYIELLVSTGLLGLVSYYFIYLFAFIKICFNNSYLTSKLFNLVILFLLLIIDGACSSFYTGLFDYLLLSIIFTEKNTLKLSYGV